MISGIIAQKPAVPRGAVFPPQYADDSDNEIILSSFIVLTTGGDKLVFPGRVTDADTFYAPRRLQVLMAAFVADDGLILAPRLRQGQLLQPLLYVAVDSFSLPAVALPGILQTHLHAADDAFFSPFIESHGSLRPSLLSAFDAIYAPTVAQAQTLRPNLYSASDTIYAPVLRLNWIFARFLSDGDVFYAPVRTGGTALATLNSDWQNVTISNGNLTATRTATTTAGARSSAYKTAGKFFFEITVTTTHGSNDAQGLITSIGNYDNVMGGGFNGTSTNFGGDIYSNNTATGKTIGTVVSGDIVGIAVNLDTRLAWFRKNAGNWYGDASANPVTGAGGVTLEAGASFAPMVGFFGGSTSVIGDVMTANFGSSPYAYARPTGFNDWEL